MFKLKGLCTLQTGSAPARSDCGPEFDVGARLAAKI